jgi:surface antigen
VGAIAQSVVHDHVAVIESVSGDGTITVTESAFSTDLTSIKNFLWRPRTLPLPTERFENYIHVSRAGGLAKKNSTGK